MDTIPLHNDPVHWHKKTNQTYQEKAMLNRLCIGLIAASVAALTSLPTAAQVPNQPGGSTASDAAKKDAIVSPRDAASGQATGKRSFQDIHITQHADKASPMLTPLDGGAYKEGAYKQGGAYKYDGAYKQGAYKEGAIKGAAIKGESQDKGHKAEIDATMSGGGTQGPDRGAQAGIIGPVDQKAADAIKMNAPSIRTELAPPPPGVVATPAGAVSSVPAVQATPKLAPAIQQPGALNLPAGSGMIKK